MNNMFRGATAFNQDLCHFGDYFSQIANKAYMFLDSGCFDKTDPTSASGPWCAVKTCFVSVKKVVISQDYPALLGPFNDNYKRTTLTLAEVQVFAGSTNVAFGKTATQSSDYPNSTLWGPASFAVDGDTNTFNHVNITTDQVGAGLDTSSLSVV